MIKYFFKKMAVLLILFFQCFQLDALLPSDILPDQVQGRILGDNVFVRKGTVFAMMQNARLFDKVREMPESAEKEEKLAQIKLDLKNIMPGLKANGLFDFFQPIEWLEAKGDEEGRIFVALIFLEMYPEKKDEVIYARLCELTQTASLAVKDQLVQTIESKNI